MQNENQPPDPGGDAASPADSLGRDEFHESVAALSRLATSRMSLEDSLTQVASFGVRAIPGADGAGLTLLEDERRDTTVATDAFVEEIEDIQSSLGQGPSITAADSGGTVSSGSLGADSRWPRFGSRVARLGVHSALSVPLVTADGMVGAINVYARAKHVFGARAEELGALFAVPAAVAVQNASVLAQTRRLAIRLQTSLEDRGVVDRAVGILMSRNGGTVAEALDRLRALSQHEHRKLTAVAQSIVDTAVRRARAGRVSSAR